ncbi:MAG: TRAP transporter small permease subunit [Pseudomonadota bacterium]
MRAINDIIERIVVALLTLAFAALVCVVGLQVLARNVLQVPMIWTPDLAQLLFAWCIFLGAAIAFRRSGHYEVNIWPTSGPLAQIPRSVAFVGGVIVIGVLFYYGIDMTQRAMLRTNPSLGISELWFFISIPISGGLMALFLAERVIARLSRSATQ